MYVQTSELPRGILESLGIFIVTFSYLIWTVWLLPYHRWIFVIRCVVSAVQSSVLLCCRTWLKPLSICTTLYHQLIRHVVTPDQKGWRGACTQNRNWRICFNVCRRIQEQSEEQAENPLMLLLRYLLPHYNPTVNKLLLICEVYT